MKISFNDYILEDFYVKEGLFCGIPARLITPKIEVKWTQKNKIFRSSIWDLDGNLLSASFPRFSNLFETPGVFPPPASLENTQILTKYDGSLCIFDMVDGVLSARTRGTFSYKYLDNFADFDYCIKKYPGIHNWMLNHQDCSTWPVSLLMEITSPNQKIVLSYGNEPDLTLIGVVNKEDYSLWTQEQLDFIGTIIGVKRPEYHKVGTLDGLVAYIKPRKDIEGICLYSSSGQQIHKVKADHYLKLHRMKGEISNFEKVLDLFLSSGITTFEQFYSYIESHLDYELAETARPDMQEICMLNSLAKKELDKMRGIVVELAVKPRKDAAIEIQRIYNEDERGLAFSMLSGKVINQKQIKQLILRLKTIK